MSVKTNEQCAQVEEIVRENYSTRLSYETILRLKLQLLIGDER